MFEAAAPVNVPDCSCDGNSTEPLAALFGAASPLPQEDAFCHVADADERRADADVFSWGSAACPGICAGTACGASGAGAGAR